VSNLRGLAFGTFVIAGLVGIFGDDARWAFGPSVAALLAFVALITWHDRVFGEYDTERRHARVNRDALSRVTGEWQHLDDGAGLVPDDHPFAADLDIVGRGSLFQRVCTARTPRGRAALAAMLSEPADLPLLKRRQEAARALAPELELRQRIEALALGVAEPPKGRDKGTDPSSFIAWAEGASVLEAHRSVVLASRVLPVFTGALMVASGFGIVPAWSWLGVAVVQVLLLATVGGAVGKVFAAVSRTQGALSCYGPLFAELENLHLDVSLIRDLRERMQSPHLRPSTSMRRFQRIVSWFELRHNGLIHPFVNAVTMWDVHCVTALERWQSTSGREVRAWLDALGELEALASFGALAYDEPDFCWPEVAEGAAHFEATALGHPLLDAERRVANDVAIAEAGHGLLVTGSNMSGKSTLLRAMGLSAVMAMAGAPVCASELRLAWCRLRTSLRIRDSLESGVSHFYAEVAKLKAALDATAGDVPVLFLLDEILHGTNSLERQIGARWVLSRLLERGAIGVVTTHDAELCRLEPPLSERIEQKHFREHVEGGAMVFDYRLRPGPVQGGNALRVMRMLGMDVPLQD
jgi:hypothetical protein